MRIPGVKAEEPLAGHRIQKLVRSDRELSIRKGRSRYAHQRQRGLEAENAHLRSAVSDPTPGKLTRKAAVARGRCVARGPARRAIDSSPPAKAGTTKPKARRFGTSTT